MYNNYAHGMYPNQPIQTETDLRNIHNVCRKYRDYYVIGQMSDGSQVEGILEDADEEGVTMLVPEEVDEKELEPDRQFGVYGGFDGYGYGRPRRRRFRRFRRRRFPIIQFVVPFFIPYPYYYYY